MTHQKKKKNIKTLFFHEDHEAFSPENKFSTLSSERSDDSPRKKKKIQHQNFIFSRPWGIQSWKHFISNPYLALIYEGIHTQIRI